MNRYRIPASLSFSDSRATAVMPIPYQRTRYTAYDATEDTRSNQPSNTSFKHMFEVVRHGPSMMSMPVGLPPHPAMSPITRRRLLTQKAPACPPAMTSNWRQHATYMSVAEIENLRPAPPLPSERTARSLRSRPASAIADDSSDSGEGTSTTRRRSALADFLAAALANNTPEPSNECVGFTDSDTTTATRSGTYISVVSITDTDDDFEDDITASTVAEIRNLRKNAPPAPPRPSDRAARALRPRPASAIPDDSSDSEEGTDATRSALADFLNVALTIPVRTSDEPIPGHGLRRRELPPVPRFASRPEDPEMIMRPVEAEAEAAQRTSARRLCTRFRNSIRRVVGKCVKTWRRLLTQRAPACPPAMTSRRQHATHLSAAEIWQLRKTANPAPSLPSHHAARALRSRPASAIPDDSTSNWQHATHLSVAEIRKLRKNANPAPPLPSHRAARAGRSASQSTG